MGKNKRDKVIIALLFLLLAILLFRLLYLYKVEGMLSSKDAGNTHMFTEQDDIQLLNMLENEYELNQKQMAALEEGEDKYISNAEASEEKLVSDRKHLPYMDLYPDMYVDTIKPVIQLKDRKIAYLTFDDGPSHITKDILKTLEEQSVKATFFVLGCTLTEEGEECLKLMVEQGHEIGIHTYSHNYKKIYASVESFLEDFYLVYNQVYEVTGIKPRIFRFPWGSENSYNRKIKKELVAEMERRGFTFYDWNVSADDSLGHPTENKILKNIMKDIDKHKKPIILMHDASVNKVTARSLEKVIKSIREKGFTFDTLNHREPYQFGKIEN